MEEEPRVDLEVTDDLANCRDVLLRLHDILQNGKGNSSERFLAITKITEAEMWLSRVQEVEQGGV